MRVTRGQLAAFVLAALGLVIVAWGATSSFGPVLTTRPLPPPAEPRPQPTTGFSLPPQPSGQPLPTTERSEMWGWIGHVVLIAAVAAGVLVAALLVVVVVRRVRQERPAQAAIAASVAPEIPAELLAEVSGSLDDALQELTIGVDVDAAILACWYRLERAAEASGVQRRASQTSSEFTLAVLAATPVDPSDLTRLAELYRRAMFSGRPSRDQDREIARACLTRLLGGLRGSWV